MTGLLTALRSELFLDRHNLTSRTVVLLPAVFVFLQGLLLRLGSAGAEARDNLLGESSFDAAAAVSGYGYFVDGLNTGLTILGLLLVAVAAYSFAAERDIGSVRHLLVRRCSRSSIVLAKLINLLMLGLLAVLLVCASSYVVSWMFWEFGPVVEDGFELISEGEIRLEIHQGLILAVLPLPAAIALGLLVSVSTRSATTAVVSALGITLMLDVFKNLLGDYAWYIYASHQPSLLDASYLGDVARIVRGYSDVLIEEQILQLNNWVPLPTMLLFAGLSLFIVNKRRL
ncbi:MAG: ABC transporter permease subunit [Pseudohongiellaceae bacterium]